MKAILYSRLRRVCKWGWTDLRSRAAGTASDWRTSSVGAHVCRPSSSCLRPASRQWPQSVPTSSGRTARCLCLRRRCHSNRRAPARRSAASARRRTSTATSTTTTTTTTHARRRTFDCFRWSAACRLGAPRTAYTVCRTSHARLPTTPLHNALLYINTNDARCRDTAMPCAWRSHKRTCCACARSALSEPIEMRDWHENTRRERCVTLHLVRPINY